MYNGVGLQTARGSGTNGYVQRNLAFLKTSKEKPHYRTEEDIKKMDAVLNRPPNAEILEHEKLRKIEVKCFELQELMEEQGYSEEEIAEKVREYRELLTKQTENSDEPTSEFVDEQGRRFARETHQIAELQQEKNNFLRKAFGIREDYVDGSALSKNNLPGNNSANSAKEIPQILVVKETPPEPPKKIKETTKKSKEISKKSTKKRHQSSSSSDHESEEEKSRKKSKKSSSSRKRSKSPKRNRKSSRK